MIGWYSTAVFGAFRSLMLTSCSLGSPLSYGSPVVVFLDRGHPPFKNVYSTVLIDVLRVKSCVNSLFDPASVQVRISINKPDLI